jgi:HPt (histidine-containing phosphotransfer) domain-containing protein
MQNLPLQQRFDPDRLRRLLNLVGPAEARGFLVQLDKDLSDCADRIAVATERQDWAALREASHVLVSLAGSAGALSLQALAEAMNAAAHERNGADLARLRCQIAPDLARLITLVRATPDPFTSSR